MYGLIHNKDVVLTGLTFLDCQGISLGGDSDTLACITGGIAEAFYQDVPDDIRAKVRELLTQGLLEIVEAFCEKYI